MRGDERIQDPKETWWAWVELNYRPSRSYRDAPPTLVGLGRVELPTSPLSGVRSSHLSYRPTGTVLPVASHQHDLDRLLSSSIGRQ